MVRTIKGDLVKMAQEGHFDIVAHGCNCFNSFGKGIAKQLIDTWRHIHDADVLQFGTGDPKKLGRFSAAPVLSKRHNKVIVLNCYTQYGYGPRGIKACTVVGDDLAPEGADCHCHYRSVYDVLSLIKKEYGGRNLKFGFPRIGCGLAGGDWAIVHSMICDILGDEDVTIVELV